MHALLKVCALVGIFATTPLAAATGFSKRQAEPSNFKLYAYGSDAIGGYPVFYADGLAYIGDSSAWASESEVTAVNFTASAGGTWTATPESDVSWLSKIFYISNATGEIGFTDSSNSSSSIITSGYRFYGRFALLRVDGNMQAAWKAKNTSVQNVWELGWGNVDEDAADTAVMLRNAAPMGSSAGG